MATCVHCDEDIEQVADDMYRHRDSKRMLCKIPGPLSRDEHAPAAWPDDHPTKLRAPQDEICPKCKHAWWWHHGTIRPTDYAGTHNEWLRENPYNCRHSRTDGGIYGACQCENLPRVPVVFHPLIRRSDTVSSSATESHKETK